jgi:glycosyltransferase involved in cell wall biosynthesis
MLISVAMCTYNGEKYIKEQINSILSQTVLPDEIIICDDGSTDDTINIIRGINNPRIKLQQNPVNLGFIKNFEQAIKKCSGDIIFLSDQDDVWLPNKVEEMIAAFNKNPDAYLIFSDVYITDKNLNIIGDSLWKLRGFNLKKLKSYVFRSGGGAYPGCSMALKKVALKYTGSFPPVMGHDTWLALVLIFLGYVKPLNKKLLYYRQHENQLYGAGKKNSKFVQLRYKIVGENIRHNAKLLPVFQQLLPYLRSLPNQTPYVLLTDYVQHLETRFTLPQNKLDRWMAICREMPRYFKYDAPLTAFMDWLVR